jgi:hypothetical protein
MKHIIMARFTCHYYLTSDFVNAKVTKETDLSYDKRNLSAISFANWISYLQIKPMQLNILGGCIVIFKNRHNKSKFLFCQYACVFIKNKNTRKARILEY